MTPATMSMMPVEARYGTGMDANQPAERKMLGAISRPNPTRPTMMPMRIAVRPSDFSDCWLAALGSLSHFGPMKYVTRPSARNATPSNAAGQAYPLGGERHSCNNSGNTDRPSAQANISNP